MHLFNKTFILFEALNYNLCMNIKEKSLLLKINLKLNS
jgi:hypothetical protein